MNYTQQLTYFIRNDIPCLFVKYGDGEFYAANYRNGNNCDGTPYTQNLGNKVRESFIYNIQQPNSMVGAWHDHSHKNFWHSLSTHPVNWVDFHTVLIDNNKPINHSNDKLNLFTSIKNSKLKKIYISNASMYKAKDIFLIDSHIIIDKSNWFDTQYDFIYESIKKELDENQKSMVLISAGMGSKYIICELHKLFPNCIYIDIGSGFDKICTGKHTRTYNPDFEKLVEYLKPILPVDFKLD